MDATSFDPSSYKQALGSFLTGVTVVTTLDENKSPIGFTANSFTSVSLEPPLVLVCLGKSSFLCAGFSQSKHFAINILSENQSELSMIFASPVRDRFASVAWRPEITGCPIINGVVAWLDCDLHKVVEAGDHVVLMGKVVTYGHSTKPPLGYFRGSHFNLLHD